MNLNDMIGLLHRKKIDSLLAAVFWYKTHRKTLTPRSLLSLIPIILYDFLSGNIKALITCLIVFARPIRKVECP